MRFFDPLVVDALVQRFPVPGASVADRTAAAIRMHDRGWALDDIAAILRVSKSNLKKMLDRGDVLPWPQSRYDGE